MCRAVTVCVNKLRVESAEVPLLVILNSKHQLENVILHVLTMQKGNALECMLCCGSVVMQRLEAENVQETQNSLSSLFSLIHDPLL